MEAQNEHALIRKRSKDNAAVAGSIPGRAECPRAPRQSAPRRPCTSASVASRTAAFTTLSFSSLAPRSKTQHPPPTTAHPPKDIIVVDPLVPSLFPLVPPRFEPDSSSPTSPTVCVSTLNVPHEPTHSSRNWSKAPIATAPVTRSNLRTQLGLALITRLTPRSSSSSRANRDTVCSTTRTSTPMEFMRATAPLRCSCSWSNSVSSEDNFGPVHDTRAQSSRLIVISRLIAN